MSSYVEVDSLNEGGEVSFWVKLLLNGGLLLIAQRGRGSSCAKLSPKERTVSDLIHRLARSLLHRLHDRSIDSSVCRLIISLLIGGVYSHVNYGARNLSRLSLQYMNHCIMLTCAYYSISLGTITHTPPTGNIKFAYNTFGC